MDARLDTLTIEMYQVNAYVGCIARRQARLGGFAKSPSPPLDAIMAQLQCMDAHLDTLNDELCQVNTRIDRIARQQARFGGFVESPSPPPEASEDDKASKDDNDSDDDDDDKDGDASCSSADKMST